jgi:hypothetical protein
VPTGTIGGNGIWLPRFSPPLAAHFTGDHPIDGKAQVTREPTGHPAADGAWGPPGPPRPRPSRAGSGPFPGAATGPIPRLPASHGQPDDDPWSGTAPGFEFERRRPPPSRTPRRTPPSQPGHGRVPRTHPGSQTAEPRPFRYTPTVSQHPRGDTPRVPPDSGWGGTSRVPPDSGWGGTPREFFVPPGASRPPAGPPGPPRPSRSGPGRPAARREEGPARAAGAEWARLLRSLLPQPVKRRWSREFLAGLEFRGWGIRVAIPILAMVVFGVAVVVIADANSGHAGPAPSAASLGFPPATLAGHDFTAGASVRGITQTLGRVTSVGDEIVAVGSQSGARIARAQFFVSGDDGRTWTMGTVKSADGGAPPPGHGAIFVAGSRGAWVALGPGSIWTSADGKTWLLAPGTGMPLRPGDQVNAVARTAHGFIAVGASVPGGEAARSTPLIFLSANGITWKRLDAARLRLAAGGGHAQDLRYVAAAGQLILIGGDAVTSRVTGKPKRTVTVQAGAAWLSGDGGATWAPTGGLGGGDRAGLEGGDRAGAAAGHGAQPQLAGLAAAGHGFVLLRPAIVARRPAADAFYSPNGLAWTFRATLSAAAGFTALMANGGPDGVAVTGQAGRNLTAFASADGQTWRKARSFGTAAAEDVSGVTLAPDGAVVTAGISDAPDARQPVLALTGVNAAAQRVDIAKIPGAVEPQVAVNGIAAQGSTQVAVGSANGYPAAWTSGNGGSSWTRAVGALPAVLSRPGSQRLTSVTHGPVGWLAVGDVTAAAPEHPVVVVSADGTSWQAADGERVFGAPGLFTEQAAANTRGYVIVGHQNIKQIQNGRVVSARTEAAVWWSATLAGWQRAGDATAGALDGTGDRQMTAVTASGSGFVAVGSRGIQPSAWTSADGGRTWRLADLPLPVGSSRAVLEHVASAGRVVVAVGTAVTTAGRPVPFAASSADGGASWAESALPVPAGLTSVTALAAAGGSFTATGTYGSTLGHQNVVVWTSTDGSAWRAAEPAGQGLTGPGVHAITGLAVAGSTLAGVGFTASPGGEQPVFWQSPVR